MPRPWLSVICPTIGRPELHATLRSIRAQALPSEVEILVVGDTHGDDFADALIVARQLCRGYDASYIEHDGGLHAWGHPQRNYGQRLARGAWLLFTQDDDAYCVGAFTKLYDALVQHAVHKADNRRDVDARPIPHIFKFVTWQAGVIWHQPRVRLGNVDADMIAVPNVPKRLQRWTYEYCSDFEYIDETVAEYEGQVIWQDAIIGQGRPAENARRHHGVPQVAS